MQGRLGEQICHISNQERIVEACTCDGSSHSTFVGCGEHGCSARFQRGQLLAEDICPVADDCHEIKADLALRVSLNPALNERPHLLQPVILRTNQSILNPSSLYMHREDRQIKKGF